MTKRSKVHGSENEERQRRARMTLEEEYSCEIAFSSKLGRVFKWSVGINYNTFNVHLTNSS